MFLVCFVQEQKLKSLNILCFKENLPGLKVMSISDLSDMTLCDYLQTGYPKQECIQRQCRKCGINQIKVHYHQLLQACEPAPLNMLKVFGYKIKSPYTRLCVILIHLIMLVHQLTQKEFTA